MNVGDGSVTARQDWLHESSHRDAKKPQGI